MRIATILKILGILLMLFSLSMLPPIIVELIYKDGGLRVFIINFFLSFLIGFLLWIQFRGATQELKARDGFLIVVLLWFVLVFFGSLPLVHNEAPHVSFTDAMFESMSGLTTTGASVLTSLSYLPHSILFYRQQLQFLGGMGIIVLAVAVLPMLGVGGMQLYQAEMPGPMKDSKLTPRITSTAKALWYIYLGLFVACLLCYLAAGMEPFDAIGESFSTVSTGGFTVHDESFRFYNSYVVDSIAMVFMILGAINFSLHFIAISEKKIRHYFADDELRNYLILLFLASVLISAVLVTHGVYKHSWDAFFQSLFTVISLSTTTGFTHGHFASWPTFTPYLIMLFAITGGCASSTSGGIKVIRVLLLYKQGRREVNRLIHPKAVLPVKFGRQILPEHVMQAMWGFISAFFVLYVILILAIMASGVDFTTAFGAVSSCLSNAGASIGSVRHSFEPLNDVSKWLLIIAMLAGRLEIFTILVLLSPAYWRR